jgi:hypothetical protein
MTMPKILILEECLESNFHHPMSNTKTEVGNNKGFNDSVATVTCLVPSDLRSFNREQEDKSKIAFLS